MARKLGVTSFKLVTNDMSASFFSVPSNVDQVDNIGFYVKWTSSDAVGTISVQGSINAEVVNGVARSGDWEDLTFDPLLSQPNSNDDNYLININQFPYPWIRIAYTRTSGTGLLEIWECTKSV